MKPATGALIAGKYLLERPLAHGGMGSVWVARHVALDVEVAVKFILDDSDDSEESRVRFQREAKASAMLKSSHVAHIYDYGIEQGTPYIAMEMLTGEDLSVILQREGRLGIERVLDVVEQMCRGLQAAHDAGIVHRDLKPSNVFIARMGREQVVKILDFGIAKMLTSEQIGVRTKSGVLIGSPSYMSPEQIQGGRVVDGRSDLWSLGVVAYEAMTGVCPFAGEHIWEIMTLIMQAAVTPPSRIVAGLPQGIDAFFTRALERDPRRRFRSPQAFADALAAVAAGELLAESLPTTRRRHDGDSANPLVAPRSAETRQVAGDASSAPYDGSGPSEVEVLAGPRTKVASGAAVEPTALAHVAAASTTQHAVGVVDTTAASTGRRWRLAALPVGLGALGVALGWLVGRGDGAAPYDASGPKGPALSDASGPKGPEVDGASVSADPVPGGVGTGSSAVEPGPPIEPSAVTPGLRTELQPSPSASAAPFVAPKWMQLHPGAPAKAPGSAPSVAPPAPKPVPSKRDPQFGI